MVGAVKVVRASCAAVAALSSKGAELVIWRQKVSRLTRVSERGRNRAASLPAMDVSSLNLALPTAGTGVPEWVHLMPAGSFKGVTGDQTYHLRDAARVIAASMTAGDLPFDENHSTQRAHATGSPSPARGWIKALDSRADGIWAKVDWNADGTALMTSKSYKNVSPVFGYAADGTVTRIISAALTNDPNLAELKALFTRTGDDMEKIAICTALGIAGTTEDAAVLAAVKETATALATAKADVTRLTGELATLKATTAPVTEVVALQTRLSTIEAEGKTTKATAFVDDAIKAGKPIAPVREQFIAMHVADPANTEATVNGMVSINAGGTPRLKLPVKGGGVAAMTAEDIAICTRMGQDPAKLAEYVAKTTEGSAA